MIIDIPPSIEQMMIAQTKEQGISVAELIIQTFATPQHYPKGDIRRLKGIVKTDIQANIDEMNEAIAMGAVYGERYGDYKHPNSIFKTNPIQQASK